VPSTKELFADSESVEERAGKLDALRKSLADSIARHDSGEDGFISATEAAKSGADSRVGIVRGAGPGKRAAADKLARLAERFAAGQGDNQLTKSLSPEQQSAVSEELEALKSLTSELTKDITVASPGNLHPYDLEAPAKILVPRFTPLRNQIARQRGQGTAREYRRILGYTNAGVGGVADQTPFFNSESDASDPVFGTLSLRRGQKIAYAMDIHTANYMEMSLSDLVTWKSQFANLGFEDTRQLSQMALLWAHLLGEEKAILWGRGASASGYEGPVAAPTYTVAGASTGGSLAAGTYLVKLTSNTGMGQSAAGTEGTSGALTGTGTVTITLTNQPTGALNYGVYMTNGATNTETFQGFFVPTNGTIVLKTFVTGGVLQSAVDTSFNANAYDGYLSVLTDPNQSGSVIRFDVAYPGKNIAGNATAANNIGDAPWQDTFASLFTSIYADPEEVWMAAPQRRQLTDYLRSAQNTAGAYRITLSEGSETSMEIGGMVTGIVNESSPTARIVDLRVHPYMPTGASIVNSRVLPIPDSHVGETAVITAVQDYMSVDWPQIQFSYDASTYWFGTMVHYAPKWSAAIVGLQ
jgi:hypothetical protein